MVLEASMIVVDNSEASRNGDYVPSRWEAQQDAVNMIFSAKTGANPESSVGLMSMGGNTPEILTTLTTDIGKVLDGLHRTKIKGSSHFVTGINVAALALKHRQNKSQKQRIVIFNCSPIEEDEKNLVKLAKKMKKSGISIDIIAFGELSDDTTRKLQAFSDNVQSAEGSYLATIPPSANLLSDSLITTPIVGGEGASSGGGDSGSGGGGGGPSGGNDFEFGVDPSVDPELALALRMSFEEEKARQEKDKKAKEAAEGKSELEPVAEGDEKQPLLDDQGQPSGRGSKDKKKDDDPDKMDTA
ncbi:RPN10 26S proteasome regulatory complex subunit RPN10 PSMD4 [Pyrenophora tritici-repentis]|uniref:26S proteasome non-ATPase regulatory protein n=1 Tax=Pyrenophora tritici-repentis TaxID=45151 RepID=A0A2W1HQZ5_9PLEO|nr:26S proteasome non-ATPase regulatory subunit 4 [Pyrenophora tritici-repentis]KAF7446026.1 26S proteasome non-ATPase regulatory protein [Pyrenophora tritici-repentis]KAG9381734.1 26S proteasome non-ATPase regulatory protein [Pyrenophora tritici-repentis]KAI0577230.1 26S proteasome non-ATPase regulatory subunit 4 [Pyrenophora tritici-repentis]KAI0609488.1 26S proteasome non-ATPase regulatory subunit 4 [Pyrenophora tritici-repentis]